MRTDPVLYLKLPADLIGWVKEQAAANRRSMTGEVAMIIETARRGAQAQRAVQPQGGAQ